MVMLANIPLDDDLQGHGISSIYMFQVQSVRGDDLKNFCSDGSKKEISPYQRCFPRLFRMVITVGRRGFF